MPSISSKQTFKQTEVIPEVVSREAFKLNHSVMNKKQGRQFSPEKRLWKEDNGFISLYYR